IFMREGLVILRLLWFSRTAFLRTLTEENRLQKSRITWWEREGSTSPPGVTARKPVDEDETPLPLLSKKGFKTLPLWDFEDIYNEDADPLPDTCADSLRKSKDENFTKAFIPNIRLFSHKDNINMSEWNRLSHFNNPYGFMGFKYNEVMPALKLIPKPEGPMLLPKPGGDGCIRCAVVGTGGILYGSKKGAEIDAHDYVFRMNGAIIKGFEEDVGSRTSVYIHSAHSITKSLLLLKKYGYKSAPHDEGIKYVMMPEGKKDFQWLEGLFKGERISTGPYRNRDPRMYYSGQYDEQRFYVLHQDFLRYLRNRFLNSPRLNSTLWRKHRPTNGAFTLFLETLRVNVYGFITDDYEKYASYYVHKNTKSEFFFRMSHDFFMEKELWKHFHNSKIIKLYQRNEPKTGGKKLKARRERRGKD
uniref:alpha-N-acetylgalactosaminide alpha-2,6-sialyltransferase n=1 Tax=Salarias fasciatus TaxID=181472 RepID=A0A672H5V1_SALFA